MAAGARDGRGDSGVTLNAMTEEPRELEERPEEKLGEKPGYGVDRSQIRRLLALSPEERLVVFVDSARNVAELVAGARIV